MRVVNVVDLMTLQPRDEHPHGLSDARIRSRCSRPTSPIVFAYHGYPWLIHRLTYRRTNHDNLHVRGYKEEGTTTTPFDMAVLNDIDRYPSAAGRRGSRAAGGALRRDACVQFARDKLAEHARYIVEHGEDMPEVRDWHWQGPTGAAGGQAGE